MQNYWMVKQVVRIVTTGFKGFIYPVTRNTIYMSSIPASFAVFSARKIFIQ
jgi:hypothetical protein